MNFRPPSPNPHLVAMSPNPNSVPMYHPSIPPSPPQLDSSNLQWHDQTQAPPSDLSTTLSLLNNLLDLSLSTLRSLSSLPLPTTTSKPDGLSRCPHNPHHLMPTESLFIHTLNCPTPLEDSRSILDSLRYPKTLKSKCNLFFDNNFVHPLGDPQSDLCFSLDDYVDLGSNFFYEDCPAIVSSVEDDGSKRIFSLPAVLSAECANFTSAPDTKTSLDEIGFLKLLPSELWFVTCETDQWLDFPAAYTYSVLRILVNAERVNKCDLPKWIIANSPRFGVVIDVSMSEHLYLLFRVCSKAIVREAHHSYELLANGDSKGASDCHLNPNTSSFECPVLVKVCLWLTVQLSTLYGEANAKSFAIGMLKHFLLNIASNLLVYVPRRNLDRVSSSEQASPCLGAELASGPFPGELVENDGDDIGLLREAIYVYQIAAAIAALRERFSLEEKIKAVRNPQLLPAYQRMVEHAYLSKRAEEERQKRPNYRPLVQHDGLATGLHSEDQQTANRYKTKEELLAEERDYKRRRMSYRGKKLKRAPKEVMRDIIEEHMEAIKRAGGTGCFTWGDDENAVFASNASSATESSISLNSSRGMPKEQEPDKDQRHSFLKQIKPMNVKSSRQNRWIRNSYNPDPNNRDQQEESRDLHKGNSYSRSPDRERSHGRSRIWSHRSKNDVDGVGQDRGDSCSRSHGGSRNRSDRWKDGIEEVPQDKYNKRNHSAKDHDNRLSPPTYSSKSIYSKRQDVRSSEDSGRHRLEKHRNDRSSSKTRRGHEDRYDRYRSSEMDEDQL